MLDQDKIHTIYIYCSQGSCQFLPEGIASVSGGQMGDRFSSGLKGGGVSSHYAPFPYFPIAFLLCCSVE